jgi:hypothetical protein
VEPRKEEEEEEEEEEEGYLASLYNFFRLAFSGRGWEFFSSPPRPSSLLPNVLGVKRQGREADRSHPSSVEVKEYVELYLHSPTRLHGVVLAQSTGTALPYLQW